jgi:hypothetical protein
VVFKGFLFHSLQRNKLLLPAYFDKVNVYGF